MGSENQHLADSDMSGIFDDPTFNSLQYDNYVSSDSPFDASRLFDLSGAGAADSPNFAVGTPSKAGLEGEYRAQQQTQAFHTHSVLSSHSAESSSQDSSSETSTRHKRKTTSESPPADFMAGLKMDNKNTVVKPEHPMPTGDLNNFQNFGRSMNNLSLEQDFAHGNAAMNSHFDFDSAASSPGMDTTGTGYASQVPMNRQMQRSMNGPPAGTIEPSQFFFQSNTASPVSAKNVSNSEVSPGPMFPNASSGAQDMYGNAQMWGATTAQNPAWSNDYSNAFASPGALGLTPSPGTNEMSHFGQGSVPTDEDRIPLHIGPIPAKSRVETQINICMTLDRLPPGVKHLHLPTHTIAKAKLLAKDAVPSEDTLELHTMLVCTSAMNQPHLRERALRKAAALNNSDVQARGQSGANKQEDEEVDEEDKPANGGEVRICTNCINRERKRAARKKLKKEEEQAHWEKYETERVIVFNTNEHKQFNDWQQSPPPKEHGVPASNEPYPPTETAMQVVAPMRIACYCRHQNEKDGFQVIFTMKDYQNKVVAQQISDSILITDDHKTHPLSTMPGQVWYDGSFGPPGAFGSQSMIDLHAHMPAMSMSKSTGNLHGMGFNTQPFHTSSSVHQMQAFPSQTTSGTMTPRNLSRPASPTGLAQAGPSKKRKSSSAHRRVPSGLAMTRVDTNNQGMNNAPPTSMPMASPFSPTSTGFATAGDGSYITMPHSSSRAQYHTNPPTPINESAPFPYGALNRTPSLDNSGFQAFYSAPSSAHQSRAPSPVQMGPNLAAYHRQQAHGGATNMPIRQNPFAVSNTSLNTPSAEPERQPPTINKVTPAEGPSSGGIEVAIYGSGFTPGMDVMFGDRVATATTYWGEKSLLCLLPPGQVGSVSVSIVSANVRGFPSPPTAQSQVFRYTGQNNEMRMMELALRFYSIQSTGNPDQWQSVAQDAATRYMRQGQPAGQQGGYQVQQGTQHALL